MPAVADDLNRIIQAKERLTQNARIANWFFVPHSIMIQQRFPESSAALGNKSIFAGS